MSEPKRRRRIQINEEVREKTDGVNTGYLDDNLKEKVEAFSQEKECFDHEGNTQKVKPRSFSESTNSGEKKAPRKSNRNRIIIALIIGFIVMIASLVFALFGNRLLYESAKRQLGAGRYNAALDKFAKLGNYEDASKYMMYIGAIQLAESGEYESAISSLYSLGEFYDSDLLSTYYSGCFAHSVEDYETAIAIFSSISTYRDSKQREMMASDGLLTERFKEYAALMLEWFRYSDSDLLLYKYSDSDTRMYENFYGLGEQLLADGQYLKARKVFEDVAEYKYADAETRVNDVTYTYALSKMEEGDYESAKSELEKLTEYSDAKDAIKECEYQLAVNAMNLGNIPQAYEIFVVLGEYKDSLVFVDSIESDYNSALQLQIEERYLEAIEVFDQLGEYLDSKERYWSCLYSHAELLFSEGKYIEASDAFADLGEYLDSKEKYKECRYSYAELLSSKGKYIEASETFADLGEYLDSKEKYKECWYSYAELLMSEKKWLEAINAFHNSDEHSDAALRINEALFYQANELESLGEYSEAISIYEQLKDKNKKGEQLGVNNEVFISSYDNCLIIYGDKLLREKKYEEAKALYEKANYVTGIMEVNYQILISQVETNPESAYWGFVDLGEYKDSVELTKKLYGKRFSEISNVDENGLRIYRTEEKYGLLDREYNIVLDAEYLDINVIKKYPKLYILTLTQLNQQGSIKDSELIGQYCIANTNGEIVSPYKYSNVEEGSNDNRFLKVKRDGLWGFVDASTGKEVVAAEWKDTKIMYDGYAYVKNNLNQWGVVNEKGSVILEPQYDDNTTNNAFCFDYYYDSGCVLIKKDIILDKKGQVIYDSNLTSLEVENIGNGLFRDGHWGEILIDAIERKQYSFSYGMNQKPMYLYKLGVNLFSGYFMDAKSKEQFYCVFDSKEMKVISSNNWTEEIKEIPGPAKMNNKYGWIGADGYDLLAPKWDYMKKDLVNNCIIAGKYNSQGNLVYTVLSGDKGVVLKEEFISLEEAEKYARELNLVM